VEEASFIGDGGEENKPFWSSSSMVVTSTFVNKLSPPSSPFVFEKTGSGDGGGGNGDDGSEDDGCSDGHAIRFSGSQLQFVSVRRYFS
tara:strand:+ start:740 stop:1003 length:264 start_codon:yes stop_codon:yes gene_type:complete